MKHILPLFLILIIFFSCTKNYRTRNINDLHITTFKIDSSSIRAIEAIDENTLIFADSKGRIGKTTNSGKSWSFKTVRYADTLAPHFRSIASTEGKVFTLSIANPALLYKLENDSITLVYKEEHPKVFYDALQFSPDGKFGIAVGDPTDTCPSIILTLDGGETWKKIDCSKLPDFEDGEAFFAASNTNIKIIKNTIWMVSGGNKARVLKSEDNGDTWVIYNTPIIQGNGPQGIYSVDFLNEKEGIVIGGDYSKPLENQANKAITKDGGITWKLTANEKEPGYKSCIQYVPNTHGKEIFAVGKTGISYSNNGGLYWKKVSDEAFYTIRFVNKNIAWLGGHQKIGKLIIKEP